MIQLAKKLLNRLYFNARVHKRWRAQPTVGFVTVRRLVDIAPTHRQVYVVEQVKVLNDIVELPQGFVGAILSPIRAELGDDHTLCGGL